MSLKNLRRHSTPFATAFAAAVLTTAGCKNTEAPTPAASASNPVQINGREVVTLKRQGSGDASKLEFLSATVIPGRAFNLFQITANVPGKGEVSLLASPSIEEAAKQLTGEGLDQWGNQNFRFGGAFLVPYANRIRGKLSADGKTISTEWHGRTITLPANWKAEHPGAEVNSMHGLILDRASDAVSTQASADGQTLTGLIHAGNFGGYWPSSTDLAFTISLTGDAVDAVITATNVGAEEEPMAIGWHPYFAIPSGDRTQARVHVPAQNLVLVDYADVFPTGKIAPVKTYQGGKYDFTAPEGKALGDMFLDDNFAGLDRTDGQVVVDVADPKSNYGVHIIGLSPEIKAVQVYAPPARQFVAVEQQYNYGDPFGKVWPHGTDTGMVTLKPGQSTTWHVRLTLFTPAK